MPADVGNMVKGGLGTHTVSDAVVFSFVPAYYLPTSEREDATLVVPLYGQRQPLSAEFGTPYVLHQLPVLVGVLNKQGLIKGEDSLFTTNFHRLKSSILGGVIYSGDTFIVLNAKVALRA